MSRPQSEAFYVALGTLIGVVFRLGQAGRIQCETENQALMIQAALDILTTEMDSMFKGTNFQEGPPPPAEEMN